jgi:hypothetical protein
MIDEADRLTSEIMTRDEALGSPVRLSPCLFNEFASRIIADASARRNATHRVRPMSACKPGAA